MELGNYCVGIMIIEIFTAERYLALLLCGFRSINVKFLAIIRDTGIFLKPSSYPFFMAPNTQI